MNTELFASIFGIFSILNSASFWWLVIIAFVAAMSLFGNRNVR